MKLRAQTINTYIKSFPKDIAGRLRTITKIIEQKAPDATPVISYGMPAFKLHGRLVYYAAFKNHIGFYPMKTGVSTFKKELTKYKHAAGSIQFPHNAPLPLSLIKKIVAFRVKENRGKAAKKK